MEVEAGSMVGVVVTVVVDTAEFEARAAHSIRTFR